MLKKTERLLSLLMVFGPKITRVEGQGNGGNILTMTKASEDGIVANGF